MPDTSLQNDKFPAHIIWDKSENIDISICLPDNIEICEIFNVPEDGAEETNDNNIKISKFELNGYIGFVFKSKSSESPRISKKIQFILKDRKTNEEICIEKTIILFRPMIKLINLPEQIHVSYNEAIEKYELKEKIHIKNIGEGTALVAIKVDTNCDFESGLPDGINDFQKKVLIDFESELETIKQKYNEYCTLIDDVILILNAPISLEDKNIAHIKEIFEELHNKFEENKNFYNDFSSALSYAYLKNIQFVTEIGSFMDYLNSIGKGKIILLNSIDVLKSGGSGKLNLLIQNADLNYHDYPTLVVPPISVICDGECQIPVHSLFRWIDNNTGDQE